MAAERDPRPNLLAVLLAPLPGLGHLVIRRPRRGLVLFLAATGFANVALLSELRPFWPLGTWSFQLGLVVAFALVLYSIWDVVRLGFYARLPSVHARRRRAVQEAIRCYLRHDFPQARQILDGLLDIDPADPVARLYLATLERRDGRWDRAIHHARKALGADPGNPFHPEIERELILAQEARRGL